MRIAEPITTLTDYALGVLLLVLAFLMVTTGAGALWVAGFVAASGAAMLGGASHGFGPSLPPSAAAFIWRGALLGAAATNYLLGAAIIRDDAAPAIALLLLLLNTVKSIGVHVALWRRPQYRIVIFDSAVTIALVLLVETFRVPAESALWILSGAALAVVAALVQLSGFRRGRAWNHNDAYHAIQAIAFYAFFRGAIS